MNNEEMDTGSPNNGVNTEPKKNGSTVKPKSRQKITLEEKSNYLTRPFCKFVLYTGTYFMYFR